MKGEYRAGSNSQSILHNGIVVKGMLVGNGNLVISGCVEGGVELKRGELTVTQTGYIEGDVRTPHANIDGEVRGNITARKKVTIGPNGRILGDITCVTLDICEGGKCNGFLQIGDIPKSAKQIKSQKM